MQTTGHHISVPGREPVLLSQRNIWQGLISSAENRQRFGSLALLDQLVAALNLVGCLVHLLGAAIDLSRRHGTD